MLDSANRSRRNRRRAATALIVALAGIAIIGAARPKKNAPGTIFAAGSDTKTFVPGPEFRGSGESPIVGEEETPDDPADDSTEAMRRRIRRTRPQLVEFKGLEEKVLRTAAENKRLKELLSDEAHLRTAAEDVRARDETKLDEKRELQRMYSLDMLTAALTWRDNPKGEMALHMIVDLLKADNVHEHDDPALRKSLVGDKTDLFRALLVDHADLAEQLYNEGKDGPMKPYLKFAYVYAAGGHANAIGNIGPATETRTSTN